MTSSKTLESKLCKVYMYIYIRLFLFYFSDLSFFVYIFNFPLKDVFYLKQKSHKLEQSNNSRHCYLISLLKNSKKIKYNMK